MFTQMAIEQELYDVEYEKAKSMRDAVSAYPEDWSECKLEDLKVGDIIYADYFPDSQKYIYTYCPEYGSVQQIEEIEEMDNNNNKINTLSIKILNHNGQLVELVKNDLSIYSRGYFMTIKKYELKHPATPRLEEYTDCYVCGEDHKSYLSE